MKSTASSTLWLNRLRALAPALLAGLAAALFSLPVLRANIFQYGGTDFKDHLLFAEQLLQGREIPPHILTHPVFQLAVLAAMKVLRLGLQNAGLLVMLASQAVAAVLLYAGLPDLPPLKRGLLSVALLLAVPIPALAGLDGLNYLGYVGVNTWHNPTVLLLKPVALLNLYFGLRCVDGGARVKPGWVALAALASVVSALIKPNLIICLLPALGLWAGLRWLRRQPVDWPLLIFGVALPSALTLVWQLSLTYASEDSKILFAPLAVMRYYSGWLGFKFLLSVWFPLLAALAWPRAAWQDRLLRLAWGVFAIGAAYTYLLAESGVRFEHANFGWSGEIALFLLFAASAAFTARRGGKRAAWVWLAGFLPHVLAGLYYAWVCLSTGQFV